MATPRPLSGRVCFGDFELDLQTAELRNGEGRIILAGKPFEVLRALLERPGELVTRQELFDRLWPNGTFVDFDQSLNKAVNRLRKALKDSTEAPALIETLPRKGYRFIAATTDPVPESPSFVSSPILSSPQCETGKDLPSNLPAPSPELATTQHARLNGWAILVLCLSASAVSAIAWLTKTEFKHNEDWVQLSPLTNSGRVYDVALSPDGRYLAYASQSRDASQPGELASLRLREIGTQKDIELLAAGPGFHGLTYSNDGNQIYVLRADPNDPFFKHLYSIPSTGGPAQKLISDVDSPVGFSPDGREFVYEHCLQPRNDIDLIIATADGGRKRHLATLHDASGFMFQPGPAWSPDSKTIAVPALSTTERHTWLLYAVSVSDGSVRTIVSSPDKFGRPIWSDPGHLILAHFDHDSRTSQLWTVSASSGDAHQITHGSGDYLETLSSTHDGRMLAGITSLRTADVWSVPASDPQDARQVTHSGIPIFDVAEAFDGKLLALDRSGVPWMMVADGSQWTRFADIQNAASVTPCGRFVVFVVDRPGMRTLVRFDRDGTHGTTLASGNLAWPVCAADGASVFYITTQQPQMIWRAPLQGGEPRKIEEILGDQIVGRVAVSPDGRYLAYPFTRYGHIPSDGWSMAIIPVNGGPPVSTRPVTTDINDLRWSPTGTAFQYLRSTAGATNVWEEPISGGVPRQLTRFSSGEALRFNWSADGKHLLITRGETATEAVLFRPSR